MGWLYGWASKKDLVDHLVKGNDTPRVFCPKDGWTKRACWGTRKVLAHAVCANNLWMVFRTTAEYAETPESPVTETVVETKIILCLLGCERATRSLAAVWGYKDVSESMGPGEVDCPKRFLATAPVADPEWRERVLAFHAKRAVKIAAGDTLVLKEGCKPDRVTVVSAKPLRATAGGVTYKVRRTLVESVEKPTPALEVVPV